MIRLWTKEEMLRAAELRANGLTWGKIAKAISRKPETVRKAVACWARTGRIPNRPRRSFATPEEDQVLIDGWRDRRLYEDIADELGWRHGSVKARLERLRTIRPEEFERADAPEEDRIKPIEGGEARHVRACLTAGGFGKMPIPWREPIPLWWRAA